MIELILLSNSSINGITLSTCLYLNKLSMAYLCNFDKGIAIQILYALMSLMYEFKKIVYNSL